MSPRQFYFENPSTISGGEVLDLLFPGEARQYFSNPSRCPARLHSQLAILRVFTEYIERAHTLGILPYQQTKYFSSIAKIYFYRWDKEIFLLWLYHGGIINWLKEKNYSIPYDLEITINGIVNFWQSKERQLVKWEDLKPPATKSKRHKKSKEDVTKVTKIALELWDKDSSLTLIDIMVHDQINIATDPDFYSDSWFRKHLKKHIPNKNPGRRPKKIKNKKKK